MKYLINLALFTALTLGLEAQTWELVYENDKDGNTVKGSKNDLIQFVRDGLPLRVAWWSERPGNPEIKVEHVANAKFMTIMSNKTVFAQIDPIIGQVPDFEQQEIRFRENQQWAMIAGSNGKMESMMTNLKTGEILGHGIRNSAFKWFVLKND